MIILLIIILLILILVGIIVFKLSNLNKLLFECKNESYFTTTKNDTIYDPRYLLNCVLSCYNDVCSYDIYNPDKASISTLTATLSSLWFKSTNKAGLVYEFENDIIIAFRGTFLRGDALIDADARYYTYPGTTIKVHKGFYEYYSTIRDQLMGILKGTTKNIHITGHSLGASVALIAAYELRNLNLKQTITLFGCPKTGNKDFVDSFTSFTSLKNIVNYFDIVPEAPEKINKMYAVQPIYIFGIEQDSDVTNHSLEVYNDGIGFMKPLPVSDSGNSSKLGGYIPPTNKLKALF